MNKEAECKCEDPPKPTFGDYAKEAMGECGKDEPVFLPTSKDEITTKIPSGNEKMEPIGPWATGRVDWGPLAGLTGTRPVVDIYSITRYSEEEWRKHNKDLLCNVGNDQHRSKMVELNSREAMKSIASSADKTQHDNTLNLGCRVRDIHRWKTELERAIEEMTMEISLLDKQKRRARQSKSVLGIVKSIVAECINRRSFRMEPDLVRDEAEEELIKEAALVKEVEDLINRTLVQIDEQLERNKATKARLEDNWSDKKEAYEIDAINVNLNNKSKTILFKPGATRFAENQSTPGGWLDDVRDVLSVAEAVKGQSCELRALLDGPILSDCVRDLRAQADKVDCALAKRIAQTDLCLQAMEKELQCIPYVSGTFSVLSDHLQNGENAAKLLDISPIWSEHQAEDGPRGPKTFLIHKVIRRIADIEHLIDELKASIRGLDMVMKTAQTRLDNRLYRPRVENCRDEPQFGLISEVKNVAEQASVLQSQLKQAEDALLELNRGRGDLEREIQVKRKSLYIDKERCQVVRMQYPSSTALAGH